MGTSLFSGKKDGPEEESKEGGEPAPAQGQPADGAAGGSAAAGAKKGGESSSV